ncbi:MAG: hypothetical protein NWS80_04230 [Akkermansiaceae bacterium]|jgi:hypothetical protein|nr:hypothetical protein [Akkermansiaceae bacterium]
MKILVKATSGALALVLASCAPSPQPVGGDANAYVLAAVKTMPGGGGYDASPAAVQRLAASVSANGGGLQEDLGKCGASFCSGATYVVFLRTIDLLREREGLVLSDVAMQRYAKVVEQDGTEIFGRWNANGPGTAKLFAELGCGTNFTDYESARPGDFMKIWWTDEIGGRERGHLVVYLGQSGDTIRYWSSNVTGGYGRKTAEKSEIRRVLFSRLDNTGGLKNATRLSAKNNFLADMLTKPFTWEQVVRECRVKEKP